MLVVPYVPQDWVVGNPQVTAKQVNENLASSHSNGGVPDNLGSRVGRGLALRICFVFQRGLMGRCRVGKVESGEAICASKYNAGFEKRGFDNRDRLKVIGPRI